MSRTNTIYFSTILSFLLILFVSVDDLTAQERGGDSPRVSPNAAVSQTIGTTDVHITYGRPAVDDRDIFGALVPFQQVWRTGANESTAIVFSDDVRIEGEPVEAGTYSLYTIPGEDEWTIILNDILSWGTQYDESGDVLRVSTSAESGPHMEQFLIYFENIDENSGHMVLHWDDTRVPVEISVD